MAAAAVHDHDQRSLTGAVLPIDDPDRVVDELVARVSGLGPLQPSLDDPTVEEFRSHHDLAGRASGTVEPTLMPMTGHHGPRYDFVGSLRG
jgi:hypothetical protein